MCPASAAETMMKAMISDATEKASAGNYPEAITTITTWIESIENNDDQVRETFGAGLVILYCSRAKLHFEAGSQSDDSAKLEIARNDVKKAEEALDQYCSGVGPNQKESIRASIYNVISADEKLRNEAFSVVSRLMTAPPTSTRNALWVHFIFLLIGLVLWGVDGALFYALNIFFSLPSLTSNMSPAVSAGLLIVIMLLPVVLFFVLVDFGAKWGWDWLSDRYSMGIYAWGIKVVIFFLLSFTVIGMIPVIYWTGKGAVRWYYRKQN
jgi:hypothetical protein